MNLQIFPTGPVKVFSFSFGGLEYLIMLLHSYFFLNDSESDILENVSHFFQINSDYFFQSHVLRKVVE